MKTKIKIGLMFATAAMTLGLTGLAEAGRYSYGPKAHSSWYSGTATGVTTITYDDARAPASSAVYGAWLTLGKSTFRGLLDIEGRVGIAGSSIPSSFGVTTTAVDISTMLAFYLKPKMKLPGNFGEIYGLAGISSVDLNHRATVLANAVDTASGYVNNLSYGIGYSIKSLEGMMLGIEYQVVASGGDYFTWASTTDISSFNATVKYNF